MELFAIFGRPFIELYPGGGFAGGVRVLLTFGTDHYFLLFHERALDMRWYIANSVLRASLALTISYTTSASGIIVLLRPKNCKL